MRSKALFAATALSFAAALAIHAGQNQAGQNQAGQNQAGANQQPARQVQETPPKAEPAKSAPAANAQKNARMERGRQFLGLGPAPDLEAAARGQKLFVANCAFCHGQNANGAEGPNLVRSTLVLHDEK